MKRNTPSSSMRAVGRGRAGLRQASLALAVLLAVAITAASCGGKKREAREKPDPVVAVVTGQTGGLQVRPAGTEVWLAGGLSMPLYERDMFISATGASLILSFPNGRTACVGPDSVVRFQKGASHLELTRGRLKVDSGEGAEALEVSTPAATAKAGMAVFEIEVAPGGVTLLRVAKGTVSFASGVGRKVRVKASGQSEASPGMAPGVPVEVGATPGGELTGGYRSLVELQTDRYFAYEESRDSAEAEAKSRVAVDPLDAWAHVNMGRALLDGGSVAGARAEFGKALEVDPWFPQALCGLGKVELVEGAWEQAAEAFSQARRADGESLEAAFGLGLASLGAGDLADAGRWFKDALDVDAQDARAWTALGLVKLLESDLDAAMADFESAIEIDPDLARAHLGSGLVLTLRRDRAGAVRELERAARTGAADPRFQNGLGVRSLRQGKPGKASAWFARLEDGEDPATRAAGFENTGAVSLSTGDAKGSVTDLGKSVDLLPEAGAFYDLAFAHMALGEDGAALDAIARAQVCDPAGWYGCELMARALLQAGMPVSAAAEARRALELNPSAWESRVALGLALAATGDAAGARAEFEAVLRQAPEEAGSATEFGFIAAAHQATGEYEKALAGYREASRIASREGSYHRFAGDVLRAMKRDAEALEEYREAYRLDPADSDARVSAASILRAGGDKDEAADELLDAIEKDAGNAGLRIALAEYLLADGDAEGALVHLEAARSAPNVQPVVLAGILVHEGNAHDRQEAFGPAVDAYALAVAQDPGRGDAWFYMAGDLERAGRIPEAKAAYMRALELCRGRVDWQKFYSESAARLSQLK